MTAATYLEHPEDVLARWLEWQADGGAALAMVTATEGGAVRDMGALMAVSDQGEVAGYVSGGCIDADVALHAGQALETGQAKELRYGAESPFKDLPLPCGGAIEIAILPAPDRGTVARCQQQLAGRLPARLELAADGVRLDARYQPKLRLRIAGRGADAIALARVAEAAGVDTQLTLRDGEDRELAESHGLRDIVSLETPSALPNVQDDAWTAFLLMFHDGDWEVPLLRQALAGPAFYIGAVGSRRTHARRREDLAAAGLTRKQIERVRGPVGLVPSMRDASMLAVSALAEVVETYHLQAHSPLETTALIMLAAGTSSRFEDGDKLLSSLRGQALIDHAADTLADQRVARRLAVVGPSQVERRARLEARGWAIISNTNHRSGQGTSLACAIQAIEDEPGIDTALVLLADMPDVPDDHLMKLHTELEPGVEAVFTMVDGVPGPPAIFHRSAWPHLSHLQGDRGARSVMTELTDTRTVDLDPDLARDVDRMADLEALEGEAIHG